MVAWTVTFGRDGDDLVIGTDPSATYFLSESEATWPSFSRRRRTISADHVDGDTILGAATNAGQQTVGIYVQAATIADLFAAREELEAATSRLEYDFTNTLDGVVRTYRAMSELPQWGALEPGMVNAWMPMSKATIVIPLNPPAGA